LDELKNSFSEIDAKEIVIDEFVGQSIPLLSIYNLVLFNNINNFILYTFSVFFLFRLFDIFKPYPINIIDKKIKNGFGVMLDDVLAGIYSVIVFFLIFIGLNYV
jgi:phosphatidylglycerophosphatase A